MSQISNTPAPKPVVVQTANKPLAPSNAPNQKSDPALAGVADAMQALSFAGLLDRHVQMTQIHAVPQAAAPTRPTQRERGSDPEPERAAASTQAADATQDDADAAAAQAAKSAAQRHQADALSDWLAVLSSGATLQPAATAEIAKAQGLMHDEASAQTLQPFNDGLPQAKRSASRSGAESAALGAWSTAELQTRDTLALQTRASLSTSEAPGALTPPAGVADAGRSDPLAARERHDAQPDLRGTALPADSVRMLGAASDAQAQAFGREPGSGEAGSAPGAAAQAAAAAAAASQAAAARADRMGLGGISAAVGTPGFRSELTEQVKLMVSRPAEGANAALREARLNLNPAELGPITVRIALDGQTARIDFTAASEFTRQALSDSLPQLAAAMHAEGLTLSGGGVHGQAAGGGGQPQPSEGGDARAPAQGSRELNLDVGTPGQALRTQSSGQGMLDLYA